MCPQYHLLGKCHLILTFQHLLNLSHFVQIACNLQVEWCNKGYAKFLKWWRQKRRCDRIDRERKKMFSRFDVLMHCAVTKKTNQKSLGVPIITAPSIPKMDKLFLCHWTNFLLNLIKYVQYISRYPTKNRETNKENGAENITSLTEFAGAIEYKVFVQHKRWQHASHFFWFFLKFITMRFVLN